MNAKELLESLHQRLVSFNAVERKAAVLEFKEKFAETAEAQTTETTCYNLHCHTFFSFNGYGYSPSYLACWAKAERLFAVGKIEFDGCEVSGEGSLVDVKDLRPIQLPSNVPAAENPDFKPGTIALRGTKWTSESSLVVSHAAAPAAAPSQKKISILESGNDWPEGVVVATDLPASWELK